MIRNVFVGLLLSLTAAHPAVAEPSTRDLMKWCSSSDPVQSLNCRTFIDGFVTGVAVRTYNERIRYCIGRPVEEYVGAFLAVVTDSERLRADPRASRALFEAMTGRMFVNGVCPMP